MRLPWIPARSREASRNSRGPSHTARHSGFGDRGSLIPNGEIMTRETLNAPRRSLADLSREGCVGTDPSSLAL